MTNPFKQFRLLLWKNFILQIRRPVGTVFEILLPVLMIAILILPKQLIDISDLNCFSTFTPVSSVEIPKLLTSGLPSLSVGPPVPSNTTPSAAPLLAYFPVNNETTKLMKNVEKTLAVIKVASLDEHGKFWDSEEHMAKEVSELEKKYIGAIAFDIGKSATELPKSVKYRIRLSHNLGSQQQKTWWTQRTYPPFNAPGPRRQSFYTPLFVGLQYAVDMAIIRTQANLNYSIPVKMQQLPYPEYRVDVFVQTVSFLLPLLVTLAFIYSAIMIIKEIVNEKQNRLKESMKMMGLANWIHWSAWFAKNLLFLLISVILITIVVKAFKIFEYSDGLLIFVIFLLFAMAAIMFGFFISTIFNNAILSMLFGAVFWFASVVPYLTYSTEEAYDGLSKSAKASMCLLPTSCLGIATRIIMTFEGNKVGVQWSNAGGEVSADDSFSLALVLIMFLVEVLVYGVLTWYIEGVYPGTYGIPKPFYFPFQKSYWCGTSKDKYINTDGEMGPVDSKLNQDHAHEEEPKNLQIGVGIKNLRKVFKSATGSKVAVDGLSLNMFQGQITALLGHNGAGKTTTMSILTGLFTPTSGSAHINQRSIITDMGAIRESLGLCPQHNVLFDRLTVKEHLIFFINLKGIYGAEAARQVKEMIEDLQLVEKANWSSSQLSGGMKRKLSCAIALIGGSKTVFLDEPTSGMDPYARRATWDLLLKHKEGRTMVLTTHFMDEADFLGDRIAIMADGQLRCSGSSLFLKSRYGVGYHLTLVKREGCDENLAINCVKRHVPSAQIISNVGAEIELILESESSQLFENLFLELETKKDEYGINSFGVSVTTMEEVFMKVGEGQEKTIDEMVNAHEQQNVNSDQENIVNINSEDPNLSREVLLTGHKLIWHQYKAMLTKRFLNSKREKTAIFTQLVLPCILVVFGLLLNVTPSADSDKPRLLQLSNLSLNNEPSKAFFADFRNNSDKQSTFTLAKNYLETVKVSLSDVGTSALKMKTENSVNVSIKGEVFTLETNLTNCCNYNFLILNPTCRQKFIDGVLKAEDCKSYSKFGYGPCPKCILGTIPSPKCNPVGCDGTNLADMNTFLTELVLEASDDKDYFFKHIGGFSFSNPLPVTNTPAVNCSGNGTLPNNCTIPSNGTIPGNITVSDNSTIGPASPYVATAWYSNEGYHIIAETLSAMSNVLLVEETSDSSYTIETTNYPLPNSVKNKVQNNAANNQTLNLAIFLALAMAYMAASFITFIVRERVTKAKHIQIVSGVNPFAYWFGTYTWDFLNYMIPAIIILILFIAFDLEAFRGDALGAVFLLLIEFGLVVLPFVYCCSYIFKSPLIAYAVTVFILSLLSLAMLIAVFVCRIPSVGAEEEAEIMHYVFLLFPTYALSYALIDMNDNYQQTKLCTGTAEEKTYCVIEGVKYTDHVLDWDRPGVGQIALYMFVEAVVLMTLTLLIEVNFFVGQRVRMSAGEYESRRKTEEDEDVFAERHRVNNLNHEDIRKESVVIKDLTKVYGGKSMTAVDHLSLAIPRGQCFGLLGINGAGKTTTFNMLTGDLSITEGTAFIDGYDIQTHLRKVQQRLGYCPQFDALIDRMTGREMLTMYAHLRGVPDDKLDDVVSSTIEQLSLDKWADKLCGNYSGGNKRKLSTAIALVGNPPIVFLDEPTTGMDPVTRRFLWDALTKVMKGGRSIVLTSHSMEECEALCTRLAIMVNGQFKCLGSTQHLKSRFGKGYTLMIKVGSIPVQNDGIHTQPPDPTQPPPLPTSSGSVVYSNPSQGLPAVNNPEQQNVNYSNGSVVNAGDVKPTVPPAQEPVPQYSVQSVGTGPIIFDQGLMQAVYNVKHFVASTFAGAVLMDEHQGMLQYQVQNEGLSWSYIFGQLERHRAMLNILDYSVSQTTLEQVFINFAKEQHSEERTQVKSKCSCCCGSPTPEPVQQVVIANPNPKT